MDKYQKFVDRFNQDLAELKSFDVGNPEIQGLLDWLLTTDANPYFYLEDHWAGRVSNASDMLALFSAIHHAFYDDGSMTFVSVNGHPKIVFSDLSDYDSIDEFLNSFMRPTEKRYSTEVEILDILPNEFGPLFDSVELKFQQRCYVHDAARNGVDFANTHYAKYSCFSPTWETELIDQIEKRKKLLDWY